MSNQDTPPSGPEIPLSEVRMVFIAGHHDGIPLSGHAWHRGRYCYFAGYGDWEFDEANGRRRFVQQWTLHELVEPHLTRELAARKLYEDIVGYHDTRLPEGLSQPYMVPREDRNPWWKDYWDDPRWAHISKHEVDVNHLPLLGVVREAGGWIALRDEAGTAP